MISGRPELPPTGDRILRVRVLGGFEVVAAGRKLTRADWQRVSAERLVKLLLVTPGRRVTREVAAETLWPGAAPEASRASLRKAVHYAGLALQQHGGARHDGRLCRPRPHPSRRRPRPPHGGSQRAGRIRSSSATRRSGPSSSSGHATSCRTTHSRTGSSHPASDSRAAGSDWRCRPPCGPEPPDEGMPPSRWSEQLLERDPADEAAHRLAIEIYAADGRHHAARRQFEQCRRALRDGLDADPSDETIEAFRVAERAAAQAPGRAPGGVRLVARQQELERVEPLLDRVMSGHLAALVIRGPAGIGKTRLLEETVTFVRAAGWRIVEWRAVESSTALAYAPLRIALAEQVTASEVIGWEEPARSGLATLLPALGIDPQLTFADRSALVAGLVSAVEHLARARPLFVAIDDLPMARSPLAGAPRDDPVGAARRADPRCGDLSRRRAGPTGDPGPPGPGPSRGRCRDAPGSARTARCRAPDRRPPGRRDREPGARARRLRPESGNPLFCLELVRAGRDQGVIRLADGRWSIGAGGLSSDLPETVRTLVASRSAALPERARDLLATAAELGPEFEFDTLLAVGGACDRDLLDALDAALASGLLVENGRGYAFAHPLYRIAVRAALGRRRRGEACLAIAGALAGVDVTGATPEELDIAPRATVRARHPSRSMPSRRSSSGCTPRSRSRLPSGLLPARSRSACSTGTARRHCSIAPWRPGADCRPRAPPLRRQRGVRAWLRTWG